MKITNDTAFLVDRYDGYFIDIWGTLYDGNQVFPEALAFLKKLKEQSKKVFLVSNAPRRASHLALSMQQKGITSDLYDRILTSGEDLYDAFNDPQARYNTFGHTFFHLGISEHNVWEGTPFRSVSFLREASFVLATGLLPGRYKLEEYSDLFVEALMLDLPMICGNPDQFVVSRDKKIWCAGKLGTLYTHSEGQVYWHGKPITSFFKKALALIGDIDRSRVLMIGDGIETDVRGANKAGIDSLFLASGMFGSELGMTREKPLDDKRDAKKLISWLPVYGAEPTYVSSSLKLHS